MAFGPERNDSVPLPVGLAAGGAAARIGTAGIAIEPLDDAILERHGFGLFPRLPATELGDADALIEESLPILIGPLVVVSDEQGDDFLLVTPYGFQDGRCGLSLSIEDQVGARDAEAYSVLLRQPKGLGGAHIRALQPSDCS